MFVNTSKKLQVDSHAYCMQNTGKTVFFQYFFTKRPIKRSVQLGPTNFWYVPVELGLVLNLLATVCGKSR